MLFVSDNPVAFVKKIEVQGKSVKRIEEYQDKTFADYGRNIEKIITIMNDEVKKTAHAVADRNNTVDDLKAVSKASKSVMEKFETITLGLDNILAKIELVAPMSDDKKEKLTRNLNELKKPASLLLHARGVNDI